MFTCEPPVLNKTCRDCKCSLPLSEFTPGGRCVLGVLPRCKPCMRVRAAAYRTANPEVHRSAGRKWRLSNPEKQAAACRSHYLRHKDYYREKSARWKAENPGRVQAIARAANDRNRPLRREAWREFYHRHKHKPLAQLRRRVTSRMHAFLGGLRKGMMREIGCTPETLRLHFELLFPGGMGWGNSSDWEIDHFYPLSAIGDNADWLSVAAVCNYRNLRPCWKSANRSKRAVVLPEAANLHAAIKDLIKIGKA